MKPSRLTIAKVMVVVAVCAADSAYLRWYGIEGTLVGTRLIVILTQLGLVGALRSDATSRLFWGGFVAFGAFALVGWFGASYWFPEVSDEHFRNAMNLVLRRFPLSGYNRIAMPTPSHKALAEVLLTIPQLLIASVGGTLAVLVFRTPRLALQRTRPPRSVSGKIKSLGRRPVR